MPRFGEVFTWEEAHEMREVAYDFATMAHISGHNPIGMAFGVPYLLDIIDKLNRIDERRENAEGQISHT